MRRQRGRAIWSIAVNENEEGTVRRLGALQQAAAVRRQHIEPAPDEMESLPLKATAGPVHDLSSSVQG